MCMTSNTYNQRYYKHNKEKIVKRRKELYKKNRAENIKRVQEWRKKNPDKYKSYGKKRAQLMKASIAIKNTKMRLEIISYYTNEKMCCQCCNESMLEFLSIDHIIPIAQTKEKRMHGIQLYNSIIKNNFPNKYQILCFNCNFGKKHHEECPHKKKRV